MITVDQPIVHGETKERTYTVWVWDIDTNSMKVIYNGILIFFPDNAHNSAIIKKRLAEKWPNHITYIEG